MKATTKPTAAPASRSTAPATDPPRAGWGMLAAAVALALAGLSLVQHSSTGATAASTATASSPSTRPTAPTAHATVQQGSAPAAGASAPVTRTPGARRPTTGAPQRSAYAALPFAGSGPAADDAVQKALEAASPLNLPAAQEQAAAAAGTRLWLAEVTGTGRATFGRYFSHRDSAAALYTRVRIQAAAARADGSSPDSAVVRLVWAGADPAGTYTDDRTATVHLHKEGGTWTPIR